MKQIILLFACLFTLQGWVKADDDKPITVNELPQQVQEFIKQYFPKNEISLVKLEKDFWEKKYKVVFVNGEKAKFLQDGSWEKIDCTYSSVPDAIIPQAIREYVTKQYPDAKILKIERDKKNYEVKLSNRLELKFNKTFQLIDIDD